MADAATVPSSPPPVYTAAGELIVSSYPTAMPAKPARARWLRLMAGFGRVQGAGAALLWLCDAHVATLSEACPAPTTNIRAEYTGIILALRGMAQRVHDDPAWRAARDADGWLYAKVCGDSEFVLNQLTGKYGVKNKAMECLPGEWEINRRNRRGFEISRN